MDVRGRANMIYRWRQPRRVTCLAIWRFVPPSSAPGGQHHPQALTEVERRCRCSTWCRSINASIAAHQRSIDANLTAHRTGGALWRVSAVWHHFLQRGRAASRSSVRMALGADRKNGSGWYPKRSYVAHRRRCAPAARLRGGTQPVSLLHWSISTWTRCRNTRPR